LGQKPRVLRKLPGVPLTRILQRTLIALPSQLPRQTARAVRLRSVEHRLKRFTDPSDTAAPGAHSSHLSGPSKNLFAIPADAVQ